MRLVCGPAGFVLPESDTALPVVLYDQACHGTTGERWERELGMRFYIADSTQLHGRGISFPLRLA